MSNVRALKLNEKRSDMYVMQGGEKRIEFLNTWTRYITFTIVGG